jgi:hypothetical protein
MNRAGTWLMMTLQPAPTRASHTQIHGYCGEEWRMKSPKFATYFLVAFSLLSLSAYLFSLGILTKKRQFYGIPLR